MRADASAKILFFLDRSCYAASWLTDIALLHVVTRICRTDDETGELLTSEKSCRCRSTVDHLTRREIEVLLLLAADKRSDEIARALSISIRTVDQHVAVMMRRADVQSRAGLIARCYGAGILLPLTKPPIWSGWRCLEPNERLTPAGRWMASSRADEL